MATPYNYLNQSIKSTCLIEVRDNDSFYNPDILGHTGFAWDGIWYTAGVQTPGPIYASWFSESPNPYRGSSTTFPRAGLVLLSKVAMTILDETSAALSLWMQFLLQNNLVDPYGSPPVLSPPMSPPVGIGSFALADNFNNGLNGWTPSQVTYADGIISVTCLPDYGNQIGQSNYGYNIDSNMIINIDFSQDKVYLDVAV